MTSLISEQTLRNGSSDLPSPDIGSTLSSKTTSLSNKLTTVLSSSYADPEIREALALLDARGTDNNAETRRNLRLDAQKDVIECNAGVVDDFAKVAEQLQRVGAMLETLNQTCDDMKRHIAIARKESAPMLEESTALMAGKEENETKAELLKAFNQHFLLSDDDLTTLTSSVEPVNDHFFAVLARVQQIYKDCEVLLGNENQQLGTELMEQTTRNLDAAFKKLYTWIQKAFKGLDFEDPSISGPIRRALRVLSDRPTLFQNCLDLFAEAREQTLSDAFHQALTETKEGLAKAIEFSTHDPLRYVGDMLAWVHATSVSELEALEGLFISDAEVIASGIKAGKNSEPWSRITTSMSATHTADDAEDDLPAFNGHTALNNLVSRNVAAISSTLRQRIILAVEPQDDLVLIFKIQLLLDFYQNIFTKILGPDASLTTTIIDLKAIMNDLFARLTSNHSTISAAELSPLDLSCPADLRERLNQWTQILGLCTPLSSEADYAYVYIYSQMVGPTLDNYRLAALTLPDTLGQAIYTLNLLQPVHLALVEMAPRTGDTANLPDHVQQQIHRATEAAINSFHATLMAESGVADMLNAEQLDTYAEGLDDWLTRVDLRADIAQLQNRSNKDEIVEAVVELFCRDYAQLEGMRRTVEDVRDLLS